VADTEPYSSPDATAAFSPGVMAGTSSASSHEADAANAEQQSYEVADAEQERDPNAGAATRDTAKTMADIG
jgi:hypothetical protein